MSLVNEFLDDLEGISADRNQTCEDESMEIEECSTAKSLSKLQDSMLFQETMRKIDFYSTHQRKSSMEIEESIEGDPEYLLTVNVNNFSVEIDNEIDILHHFVRSIYRKPFPELEQLIPLPFDYLRTVQEFANHIDQSKSNGNLSKFLTQATIMIVSVSASTTQGIYLTDEEIQRVLEACDLAMKFNENKQKIFSYVESRMTLIAPNLSMIIGASRAAKLMGLAGGLSNLAKMPSCDVLLLGAHQKFLAGFSTTTVMPHAGAIFDSKIIQDCPSDLRVRLARLVACKVSLAARVDSFHQSPKGKRERYFLNEIQRRLKKLQEPPPVKAIKPLSIPINSGRKRGGRRHRKMKEKLAKSEYRTQADRMEFGKINDDAYQDDMGYSIGMIGKSGSGKLRAPQVNSKTNVKMSRKRQKNVQCQNNTLARTTTVHIRKQISGTASSVTFTPHQGLEIVNLNAVEKDTTGIASEKYFPIHLVFPKMSPSVTPKTT